ncbi:hypothetical protein E0Z10_g1710 [Xylaria hypoxylon]|uniref:PNPLA domain-containing protein n=1 Tax=Xylaria hypoxylon TaxID=37992 RepID=A0A4Z0Z621_9PEZI|nr:hypothetical protein E0Z10_g1710 [Xylaria hypoxylon]
MQGKVLSCEVKCWEKRRAHRDGKQLGPGGIPHEQVSPNVVERVDACVAGPENEVEEREQHENDQDTTWFGLDRDLGGDPVLSEYRRYAAIMMANAAEISTVQYPALVSFVGQTNAGKSTLIRLLINPVQHQDSPAGLAAPVVGRGDSELPTSADVHLYADPGSFSATQPILFADCEGFEGGERNPVASGGGSVRGSQSQPIRRKAIPVAGSTHNPFRRFMPGTRRALAWARRDAPDRERTSKRQYAVAEMYPRIFYAFSDVIVFVLNNPKTMEDVVEKLLAWADTNRSKSVNLPSKPYAIIALNKCPNSTPDALWNTLEATDNLYKSMNSQIQNNNTFQAYVKKWESSRLRISDMEELFRCYYSKVHVIRIPDKSRYKLLEQQRDELYLIIRDCCSKSLMKKRESRMLPDTDEFGIYISLAFDHFSQTLEEPFDYVKASLRHQPPPQTMADKLYTFARLVAQRLGLQGKIETLFAKLTDMVASCLMLGAARKRLFGQPDDWFKVETRSSVLSRGPGYKDGVVGSVRDGSSIQEQCQAAVETYFNYEVPCQFHIESHNVLSVTGGFDCRQRKATHGEMHRSSIKYISDDRWGKFEHDFNPTKFNWPDRILERMEEMQKDATWYDNGDSRQARVLAHGKTLQRFYKSLTDDLGIFSNSVCLCCLSNPPDHELSCGHIICLECAKDFGRSDDPLKVIVDQCPMHDNLLRHQVTRQPTVIGVQPPHSGLRVLVLDGGGVRGIVELSVLRALEGRIGIPLHRFFDLVVGTSTGGIISLGFGHELWSIDECIERFRALVGKAFTPRKGQEIRGIRHLQLFIKRSKYETKPIEDALQSAFGDGNLFGTRQKNGSHRLKVAVAAVSEAGTKSLVLSNYNTNDGSGSPIFGEKSKLNYQRYRPTQREDELRVWEAARAASAAPGFFRPFVKARSPSPDSDVFPEMMDGAILHNNPIDIAIAEARKLASAQEQQPIPDLVLSVGTGLPKYTQTEEESSSRSTNLKDLAVQGKMGIHRRAPFIRTIFTMISYQIKLNLDSERRWVAWSEPLLRDPQWKDRLYRFNPDFGEEPPPMDDVGKIQSLSNNVVGWIENHADVQEKISQVACSLVASSFYFERVGKPVQVQSSSIQLRGLIRCRISENSQEIRALGAFFASCHSPAAFVVEDSADGDGDLRIEIPVGKLREHGLYEDIHVDITISSETTNTTIALDLRGISKNRRMFNISGFPRQLMQNGFQ